jgi:hypothetical protein
LLPELLCGDTLYLDERAKYDLDPILVGNFIIRRLFGRRFRL